MELGQNALAGKLLSRMQGAMLGCRVMLRKLSLASCLVLAALACEGSSQVHAQATIWNGYQGSSDVSLNFVPSPNSDLHFLGVSLSASQDSPDNAVTLGAYDEWTVDTGSTGVVISAHDLLNDYGIDANSLSNEGSGSITYSSSGLTYSGFYSTLNLGLYNATSATTGALAATAQVPVLIATELNGSASNFSIEQFGVGFGRGNGASDKNPLLNLTGVTSGNFQTMAPGYVVSSSGIQLGLTAAQLDGTVLSGLLPSASTTSTALTNAYAIAATQTDWQTPATTITITNAKNAAANGTFYGSLLVDTGIANVELSTGGTYWDPDFNIADPSKTTGIEVYLPGSASAPGQPLSYSLVYQGACTGAQGDCPQSEPYANPLGLSPIYPINSSNAPTDGIAFPVPTASNPAVYPFVNSGDQFLNYFNIIYDPVSGFFGYQMSPSAQQTSNNPALTDAIALQGATQIPDGTTVSMPTLLYAEFADGYSGALGPQTVVQLSSPGKVTMSGPISSAVICGTGGLNCVATALEIASGRFILTANNAYIGETIVDPGATLTLAGAGSIASSAGVAANGTFDISSTTDGASIASLLGAGSVTLGSQTLTLSSASSLFAGTIGGTGGLAVSGGAEMLTGANNYTGATSIAPGTALLLGGSGSIADTSNLLANGVFDISGTTAGASIASLSGTGSVNLGGQMLTLTNANGTFSGTISGTGGLTVTSGTAALAGDTNTDLEVLAGAGVVNSGVITGDVANAGGFVNSGNIDGNFVNTNALINAGTLSGVLINAGLLSGPGAIGTLFVSPGGVVTPDDFGVINVNGNVTFAPGSIYLAALGTPGTSNLIRAQGTASVGNATLALVPGQNFNPILGAQYTVLTAAGGVLGNFTVADNGLELGTPSSPKPFLRANLTNTGYSEDVTLVRSTVHFASLAQTPNQANAAAAADSLGASSPLVASLVSLMGSAAPAAFTSLSGEIYPSLQSVLLTQSSYVRGAVENRLRQVAGGAPAGDAAIESAPLASTNAILWEQSYGGWDSLHGNADTAPVTSSIGGFMMGVDHTVGAWRVGVAGGFGQSSVSAPEIASSGTSNNYDFAVYAGRSFASGGPGTWALRLGSSYSRNGVSARRNVLLPNLQASYSPGYVAQTGQVFGEVAYGVYLSPMTLRLEPFAGFSYARVATNGFSDGTGAAALTARGSDFDSLQSMLGARAALPVTFDKLPLILSTLLGWQHCYRNLTPSTSLAYAGGPVPFTAYGVPLASNALLAGASISGNLGSAELSLTFAGQITPDVISQNALNGSISWRF